MAEERPRDHPAGHRRILCVTAAGLAVALCGAAANQPAAAGPVSASTASTRTVALGAIATGAATTVDAAAGLRAAAPTKAPVTKAQVTKAQVTKAKATKAKVTKAKATKAQPTKASTTPPAPTTPPPEQCTPSATQTLRGVTQAKSGYLPLLKPAQAWPIARGAGVRIALLDTGVAAAAAKAGGPLAGRLVDGGNFAGDTDHHGGLLDCNGQGTGDAGLIAATDGGAGLPGIAPDATIVSVRVQIDSDVAPKTPAVVRGIGAALAQRANVIVLASPCTPSAPLAAAIKRAVRAGVVVVAAVGDPQTATRTSYPAMYPGVLGVASSGSDDNTSAATGSFVDLSAPASGLVALSVLGHGYQSAEGTARAAALTAGTAALVRSAYPRLSLAAVTTRLEYSADHPDGTVPNASVGWGVVNPYAALTLPIDRTVPPSPAPASHLGPVVLPPPDNPSHRYLGAEVAAVLLCAALAATGALAGVRRARRRRWRVARHD